jgi:hypothetical protein
LMRKKEKEFERTHISAGCGFRTVPKSVTRTVRLDEDIDEAMYREATNQKVTVNFLVTRALRKFIEWDLIGEKLGITSVFSTTLTKLLEDRDEAQCYDLGKWAAKEAFKPFTEYVFGEFSITSCIESFRRFSMYSVGTEFDMTSDNKKLLLVLRHNLGPKWSKFYQGVMSGIFEEEFGREMKIQTTGTLCIVQIERSQDDTMPGLA